MMVKKKKSSKTKKVKDASKTLRRASYHFAGDILKATVDMTQRVLLLLDNCNGKNNSEYKLFLNDLDKYLEYVKFQAESMEIAAKHEKEQEDK